MLEIAIVTILILNSNCYMPVNSERAHTLSQYDQLTTSRLNSGSLPFFHINIFSNLGWIKKEKLSNHKVVTLGQVGVCRLKEPGVVTLGSLTREECLLVDGRTNTRGCEVRISGVTNCVSIITFSYRHWWIYFPWPGWIGDIGICSLSL